MTDQPMDFGDRRANELVATGALYMMLTMNQHPGLTVEAPHGNTIGVQMDFLKDPYLITITMEPEQ